MCFISFIIICVGVGEAAGVDVKRKMLKWKNETLNQTLFNSHLGLMTQSLLLNRIYSSQVEFNTSVYY